MKYICSILLVLCYAQAYSQVAPSVEGMADDLIELESTKIIVLKHPNKTDISKLDSISIQSDYFNKRKTRAEIIQYNISALSSSGELLFQFNPRGNKIPVNFKKKIANCSGCTSIRIDNIRIKWGSGSYTLKKRLEWNLSQ